MKFICVFVLIFVTKIAFAQDDGKELFFEFRLGLMPTVGNVNIQGVSAPWINTLSSDADISQKGDSFFSTNFGIAFGKSLSPKVKLALGVDVDFYHNISEGNTSRAIPFYGDFRYSFHENNTGLFVYAQSGYSFIQGTDWHTGFKSGVGIGYSLVSATGKRGFNFSLGYNYQVLNKMTQQILGPPTQGVGYYGPTTVRYLSFAGYKNIIIHTLPLKIAYDF